MTKDEKAIYNALTLYADEDGEINQDISFYELGNLAGVGEKNKSESARRVLKSLALKGYVKAKTTVGAKIKEISILK